MPLDQVQQTPRRPSAQFRRGSDTKADIARRHGTDERTLISQLTGDLDWICLKALEEDLERRYASVSEFAEDIRRHLAHRPVLAGRPGALYRARKFVRRNRVGVLAGVAVTGALLTGAVGIVMARLETADKGEQLLKLRDRQLVAELVRKADEDLWPPFPGAGCIADMEVWMETAGVLLARLEEHQRDLARIESRALPSDETSEARSEWRFASYEDNLLHGELSGLVADLVMLRTELLASEFTAGPLSFGEHGWSIPQRLAFARDLEPTGALGASWASTWAEKLPSIRADYPGLDLHPQRGLLPLGPDPVTGLWEFAELLSGTPAVRGPDGWLRVTGETGLVLVLLPGGTTWLGSQADPAGPNYDPAYSSDAKWAPSVGAVREVSIPAFFTSKYEMTQGQWARFTGQRPSQDADELLPGDRPVNAVTWNECATVLERMGLALPTGNQWEYAARAGTETPWWTGEFDASLESKENILDEKAAVENPFWASISDPLPWSDPDVGPAAVGSYAANGFGLFDVLGNLSEWTAPVRDVPELALPIDDMRRARGGHYKGGSHWARSGCLQMANGPNAPKEMVGLRPARLLDSPRATGPAPL